MKNEIINFYEKKGVQRYLTKTHNPHFDKHHIKIPFRMLIVGNSGSMKTNTLLNLIHIMNGTFERIVIILKSKDEPLYNYMRDKIKDIEIYEYPDLPDMNSFDKNVQSLVVMDDLVLEKNQKMIEEMYIRFRKKGASLCYISQSFYLTPKTIRNNLTHIILKQVSSFKNLTMIMREYSLGLSPKIFKEMYEECCNKDKQNFLLIDLENPDLRYRRNWNSVIILPENT